MSTEIVTSAEQMAENGMQLSLVSDPAKQIEQATRACTALMGVVEAKGLFEVFGRGKEAKRHLKVEAWLLLGHFFGVTTRTENVQSVQDDATGHFGFEATVEAVHAATGRVVGRAVARCMSNEENWGMVSKYDWENGEKTKVGERQKAMQQLESMAQTRATSKALSSVFRWVVILGAPNISGTPAEEMGGEKKKQGATAEPNGAKRISDAQRKRIFAIAHEVGYDLNELPALAKKHGFEMVAHVTTDKYDAFVKEVQNWKTPAAP